MLQNPEQLTIFACCEIRIKVNVPTNFNLVMNDGENNDIRILFDAPRDRKINAWCFLFRLDLFFLLFSKCFDGIVLICSTKNQYFLRKKLWDLKTTSLSIWTMKSRNLQLSKNSYLIVNTTLSCITTEN